MTKVHIHATYEEALRARCAASPGFYRAEEIVLDELAALRAERDKLAGCRDELREATDAIEDPTVNLTRTLPEAIRALRARVAELAGLLKRSREYVIGPHYMDEYGNEVGEEFDTSPQLLAEIDAALRGVPSAGGG